MKAKGLLFCPEFQRYAAVSLNFQNNFIRPRLPVTCLLAVGKSENFRWPFGNIGISIQKKHFLLQNIARFKNEKLILYILSNTSLYIMNELAINLQMGGLERNFAEIVKRAISQNLFRNASVVVSVSN